MSPKINTIGFGSHGHVQKSETHEHDGFSVSPIMKSKSYYSKMKQNNSSEILSFSFNNNIYNKNDPPDSLDRKSGFFPGCPRFSIGNCFLHESMAHGSRA